MPDKNQNQDPSILQQSVGGLDIPFHKHGGADGPLIPLSNIAGNFPMVTTTPTFTPTGGVQTTIAFDTTTGKVYYYDFTNNAWKSIAQSTFTTAFDYQVFSSTGTWTKPSGASANSIVMVQAWGSGGGGGGVSNTPNSFGGGGGGGAFVQAFLRASDLASSLSVTINAGGAGGVAGVNAGAVGGNCTFAQYVTAYGGGGGAGGGSGGSGSGGGGGGGGTFAVGTTGTNGTGGVGGEPLGGAANTISTFGGAGGGSTNQPGAASIYGGGGGGCSISPNGNVGGASIYGGGGGASGGINSPAAGGASVIYGGTGGVGGDISVGLSGFIPGGGGGGAGTNSNGAFAGGAGARGEVRVWTIL